MVHHIGRTVYIYMHGTSLVDLFHTSNSPLSVTLWVCVSVMQNLAYGRNSCCLDLHLPVSHRRTHPASKPAAKPVVMFVFGGAWSTGDKSMYGALCAQLVQRLDVLVCCPNYSLYPQVGV